MTRRQAYGFNKRLPALFHVAVKAVRDAEIHIAIAVILFRQRRVVVFLLEDFQTPISGVSIGRNLVLVDGIFKQR